MLSQIAAFVNWLRRRNPGPAPGATTATTSSSSPPSSATVPPDAITFHDVDRFVAQQARGPSSLPPSTAAWPPSLPSTPSCPTRTRTWSALSCPTATASSEPQRLPRPVQNDDLRKFFAVIDDAAPTGPCSLLMLRCGLRISEVAGLQLADLYLDEPHPRLVAHGKGSQGALRLPLPAGRAGPARLPGRAPGGPPSDFVFLSYLGDGLSTTAIHKRLMRYRERAGVQLTAHRLRHSFANDLVSADVPVTSIQKLLGHAWLETTQTYVAANDRQVQADYYAACRKLEGWQ